MSLAGIRSLSLIETPPVDRYPVQTYVLEENSSIIKDAIYKELARSGQVFILYNNIENIEQKKVQIESLVPEARIICGHGKMEKNQLEDVMYKFMNKEPMFFKHKMIVNNFFCILEKIYLRSQNKEILMLFKNFEISKNNVTLFNSIFLQYF